MSVTITPSLIQAGAPGTPVEFTVTRTQAGTNYVAPTPSTGGLQLNPNESDTLNLTVGANNATFTYSTGTWSYSGYSVGSWLATFGASITGEPVGDTPVTITATAYSETIQGSYNSGSDCIIGYSAGDPGTADVVEQHRIALSDLPVGPAGVANVVGGSWDAYNDRLNSVATSLQAVCEVQFGSGNVTAIYSAGYFYLTWNVYGPQTLTVVGNTTNTCVSTPNLPTIQKLTFAALPASGTWTITSGADYSTTPTSSLAWNIATDAIKTALETIYTGSTITVAASLGELSYTLSFGGTLAGTDIDLVSSSGASLTGASAGIDPSDIVSASFVVTGHDNYTGGDAGTYPTTATSEAAGAAAQLVTDKAAVDAEKANIVTGTTILTKAGEYPTTATSKAEQLVDDQAAIDAAKADILNTRTILTVTGTFNEAARNTDPGESNVRNGTTYTIINVGKTGTLSTTGGPVVIGGVGLGV